MVSLGAKIASAVCLTIFGIIVLVTFLIVIFNSVVEDDEDRDRESGYHKGTQHAKLSLIPKLCTMNKAKRCG